MMVLTSIFVYLYCVLLDLSLRAVVTCHERLAVAASN